MGRCKAKVERAEQARDLRIAGHGWEEIAKHHGYPTPAAARASVQRYAKSLRWGWRSIETKARRARASRVVETKARQILEAKARQTKTRRAVEAEARGVVDAAAYELRADGLLWDQVRERLGLVSCKIAEKRARRHAMSNSLSWPLSINRDHHDVDVLGRTAYQMARQGDTWAKMSATLKVGGNTCVRYARLYAEANELLWPLPSAYNRNSQGREAYLSRLAGNTWTVVAAQVKYSRAVHAIAGARRHAEIEGLLWPLSIKAIRSAA